MDFVVDRFDKDNQLLNGYFEEFTKREFHSCQTANQADCKQLKSITGILCGLFGFLISK